MNIGQTLKQAFGAAMNHAKANVSGTDNSTIFIAIGIIILVFIVLLIGYNTSETFANTVKNAFSSITGSGSGLKDLEVSFFVNPSCSWCEKQLDVLKKEGTINQLTVKSIDNPDYQKEAMALGVKGFPFFISKKNKTALMGFQDTTADIVKGLQVPTGEIAAKETKSQEEPITMVILTRESCGWCKKAKEDIAKNDAKDVAVIAIDSEDGKAIVDKFKVDNKSGVPIYVNITNGRSKTGFMPLEKARAELA